MPQPIRSETMSVPVYHAVSSYPIRNQRSIVPSIVPCRRSNKRWKLGCTYDLLVRRSFTHSPSHMDIKTKTPADHTANHARLTGTSSSSSSNQFQPKAESETGASPKRASILATYGRCMISILMNLLIYSVRVVVVHTAIPPFRAWACLGSSRWT